MWREKMLEQKAKFGISTRTMSERSKLGLSEWTIVRILTGKTPAPRIDTILDVGETLEMSPQEIFSETISVVGDKSYTDLMAERDALLEANKLLTVQTDELTKENAVINKELEQVKEMLLLKDEIIRLLKLNGNRE